MNIASDVSLISSVNQATGVQRVVVETHRNLIQLFKGTDYNLRGLNLRENNQITNNNYLLSDSTLFPPYFKYEEADVILCLDLNNGYVFRKFISLSHNPIIITMIHDILPITHPQFFDADSIHIKAYLSRAIKISKFIITTSEYTKNEILRLNLNINTEIQVIPLGSYHNPVLTVESENKKISIIAVNTIDPRKGHSDLLDAFDILLAKKYDIELVIVGRYNLNDNLIRDRILSHKEFGGKLNWFNTGISDLDLENLYSRSNISVVASYAEGFGLTVEEGLASGNKVIARDIDVFRERSYTNLYFFSGKGPELAEIIIEVSGKKLDIPSISKTRTMKDFSNELKNLIYSLH
jgi:glycosyltransferase involved in cell wall biosynthesis